MKSMLARIGDYFGTSAVRRRVRQRRVSCEYAAEIQQLEARVVFTAAIAPVAVSTVVIPPVVASLQTGGNVFNPKIRQVYATGTAAVRAVGTPNTPSSPVTK